MSEEHFTLRQEFDVPATLVFEAVLNVDAWWAETIEGATHVLNDEFIYRYKDLHYSKHRLEELLPNKRIVWRVIDSHLSFAADTAEWTGTSMEFDVIETGQNTILIFTHKGLTPDIHCFKNCSGAWSFYILESLGDLIRTGKGKPDKLIT